MTSSFAMKVLQFRSRSISGVLPKLMNCSQTKPLSEARHCTNCLQQRLYATKQASSMNIFDRNAKRRQRNRTSLLENYEVYDYIKDEIGYRMADRISDVKRKFNVAVDLGCGRGHVSQHIYSDMVGTLYQTDMAEMVLAQAKESPEVPTYKLHVDEEFLPFADDSLDLVISNLSLHWVNNLPSTFKQIYNALKNDGCFMGAIYSGDTLFELRVALQQAETEREGGFSPHISPFVAAPDVGGLLTSAGFVMLTIDTDELIVNYPTMFELMNDLKGMGENNCSWNRRLMIPRDTLTAAAALYQEMYGSPDKEGVPATFQMVNFIAWKPDPNQKGPAERGSGQVSIKDIDKLDQLTKEINDINISGKSPHLDSTIDKLSEDIERLRKLSKEQLNDDSSKKK